MRVLVVDPPLFTLPYDQHFCRALARAGVDTTLVGRRLRSFEQQDRDEPFDFRPLFYRHAENAGSDWRTTRLRKMLKGVEHLSGLRALERLVDESRADIVHLQWLVLPFFDARAFRRIGRRAGLVLTLHDSVALHGAKNASWLQFLGDRQARLAFDHYVVHTEQSAVHLREAGIERARIHVLPHPPLDLAPEAPLPGRREGCPRILFFGQIKHYKGVDVLVEAGIALAARGLDFVIEIAGRPFEPVDHLQERIKAAGAERHFAFDLRYIPDDALSSYLRGSDIVVFPYREIDASGALTLAVEAERPIVASRVGVFAEKPAGDHLQLVAPDDAAALADALAPLIGDAGAREKLAERTRTLKAAMFRWDDFARHCAQIYQGLIHRP